MNWLVRLVIRFRLRQLNAKFQFYMLAVDLHKRDARRLLRKADTLEPFERPGVWAKLQCDANSAKLYARILIKEAEKVAYKIKELEGVLDEHK